MYRKAANLVHPILSFLSTPALLVLGLVTVSTAGWSQTGNAKFFNEKVLPVLSKNCFACHSSKVDAPRSGLVMDSKAGLAKGGVLGGDVIPGKPDESRLIKAISYADPQLQMPPAGRLPDNVIADFRRWVQAGALDPRKDPPATAAVANPAGVELFEKKIRPVLSSKCFSCHSSSSPAGGLALDTNAGLRKGGSRGPVLTAGDPSKSRLVRALTYSDSNLRMPPSGKLPDNVIADFRQWVSMGAPDPRKDAGAAVAAAPLKGMSIEDGRKWWSFQPVVKSAPPPVSDSNWARTAIDSFILAKLDRKKLRPSPAADKRTLAIRAYVDLLGYRPTLEEVQAFENDPAPDAYPKLVDQLLASPHYGERWARHWMDVARFGEDNPTTEATNPAFPFAWRYRDWIIEALNHDMPYDRFVTLQLAADKVPNTKKDDLRALGYLGTAPIYHKDQKLSAEVISTFMTDDWDDRIDSVSRGILGLSVACARCHDHKFDPIPTRDYYALQGVFASTMRSEQPMFDVDPAVEERYMWLQRRLFDLHYAADNLTNEASTVDNSAEKVAKWTAEIATLKEEVTKLEDRYPLLVESLQKYFTVVRQQAPPAPPVAAPDNAGAAGAPGRRARAAADQRPRRAPLVESTPFMNTVYDAGTFIDGSDKDYTFINYVPGQARDMPILKAGSVSNQGEVVPRGFLSVLAKSDPRFTQGSGRLELANRIFSDAQGLTARVIVNRVWGWHFGKPLVATPSDFGTQGEKPSHPELLDDLAARFIEHGWSLKWLHREIMLSAAYQQSSRAREDGRKADEDNALLWRMNPRRLDAESYRDSLLRSAGALNEEMYGPQEDSADSVSGRRTIYTRVSRARPASVFLSEYDFPDPMLTAPGRESTTTPMQQLFILNSDFIHELSVQLAKQASKEATPADKAKFLYQRILSRPPTETEMSQAEAYLNSEGAAVDLYAQALLETNEEIFWP